MLMDLDYIEKHDIINRYNTGRLNDEERSAFEVFILENPRCIPLIEEQAAIAQAHRECERQLKPSRFSLPLRMWLPAVAAFALAAVLLVQWQPGASNAPGLQPPILLQGFRGNGDAVLRVSGSPVLQLRIDVGPPSVLGEQAYRLELVEAGSGNLVYSAEGLRPDEEGWLNHALSAQASPLSGLHEVRLISKEHQSAPLHWTLDFQN